MFLEDLKVKPGDMVTYYARATDVGKGRRSTESRSDIFFLEVKPYEEEFVATDSQAPATCRAQQTGLEELIAQQKDIMAATWKLDARARRGGAGVAVAHGRQGRRRRRKRRSRTRRKKWRRKFRSNLAAQRRRIGTQPRALTRPGEEPLPKAIEAMGRPPGNSIARRLRRHCRYEEQALAELLKAAAEIRRRQVAMQQARGGGGNGNREQPDLSTLFDQELRKRQATNYEQQSTTEDSKAQDQQDEDPLAGIRELARRQESLSQQQRDLANRKDQLSAEELKRQLERLTRDQEELRQQAEELSKKMQQQALASRNSGQQANRSTGQQANRPGNRPTGQRVDRSTGQVIQAGRARKAIRCGKSPIRCAARLVTCVIRIRSRRARVGQRPANNCAASNSRCKVRGRKSGAGPWATCSSRHASSPTPSGVSATKRRGPRPAMRVTMRGGDWLADQERLADRTQRLGESVKQMARQ